MGFVPKSTMIRNPFGSIQVPNLLWLSQYNVFVSNTNDLFPTRHILTAEQKISWCLSFSIFCSKMLDTKGLKHNEDIKYFLKDNNFLMSIQP